MRTILLLALALLLPACSARPGAPLERKGDEIVVCGQLFHTGAPVVLWTDPGGYDAYRTEKRFAPWRESVWTPDRGIDSPARYGLRFGEAGRGVAKSGERLSDDLFERVRGGGWDLPSLREHVDQFVIHYDVCGTSRQCFRVLQDVRGLSVHFMLDVDGTIYQTLDVKERAWHATTSNDRSVGIEIANIGAYPAGASGDIPHPLPKWYATSVVADREVTRMTLPPTYGDGGIRTSGFVATPIRAEPVVGEVQGQRLVMYDLTPEQYDSLTKLTAALCTVLPRIQCDAPRDADGRVLMDKLPDEELATYRGLLGHFHIQENKTDPGPAFQWDLVVGGARQLMGR